MFTQCSQCETVFRLSADALRAAGGQVRCGRCGEVFNALARLAEDSNGFTKGDSSLDQETRADAILESTGEQFIALSDADIDVDTDADAGDEGGSDAADPDETDTGGVAMARLEFLEPLDELTAETSLEFTLPPGELDRIFIETRANSLQQLATNAPRGERATVVQLHPESMTSPPPAPLGTHPEMAAARDAPLAVSAPAAPTALTATPAAAAAPPPIPRAASGSPTEVPADAALPKAAPPTTAGAIEAAEQVDAPQAASTAPPPDVTAATSAIGLPLTRVTSLEVSEDVRQAMLSSFSRSKLPQIDERRRTLPLAAWLGAGIVLGLLLMLQIVSHNGNGLSAHSLLLGGTASTASLSSYQLRQWGVTGDPAAKGTLRVRASIMNTAAQLQPYPLLRVSLVNRFGSRVGAREFEPAEYLGKPVTRMLAPGERTDATLDILDPGKDARVSRSTCACALSTSPSPVRAKPPRRADDGGQDRALHAAVQHRARADGGRHRPPVSSVVPSFRCGTRCVGNAHRRHPVVGHAEITPAHGPQRRTGSPRRADRRL